ncbi:MAG TPA: hypothetical protein VHI93_02200 [Candidatus Thermoplasmatota archaeon]|nr:hypothetical protein [Candidatus Thermoplasmatota archaeon]
MGPTLRKLALTAHVAASVGWLGAVAAFLALALVGLAGRDAMAVRGAYLAMAPLAWSVIVPLCLASLATGLVQSLGTPWGLFRHYWVVVKLAITVVSTLLLVAHMQAIDRIAGAAAQPGFSPADHLPVRVQMAVASGAAVGALLVATALSVFKPRGLTPYGVRRLRREREAAP